MPCEERGFISYEFVLFLEGGGLLLYPQHLEESLACNSNRHSINIFSSMPIPKPSAFLLWLKEETDKYSKKKDFFSTFMYEKKTFIIGEDGKWSRPNYRKPTLREEAYRFLLRAEMSFVFSMGNFHTGLLD